MIKILRTLWAALLLIIGVLFAALVTTAFMLAAVIPVGTIAAITGNSYWHQIWLAFDCFWNTVLGGNHRETISSRLGKSLYYLHPPVFKWRTIDNWIAWLLHQVDHNHCYDAIDWEVGSRANQPAPAL